ncbi:carbohydrate kinase family protein [Kineosporia succinea]|uniref:Sugar/nucleoside kinase (Ribokinase family) n=1 Tax=Kineosporia succinea TaxID=84632 RepID=A0ABT9NXS5_9ACTN|nr:PfkB family carbohydrate kinase [Kineosporia succinea]MDP9824954.1 sugar/nucleoside kinase (ribokinase family) [Kineosporia succinea]
MFDVVAVGALNLDYIAPLPAGSPLPGPLGTETAVPEDVVVALLPRLEASGVTVTAGGSSFNVVEALSACDLGLSLGYVGVAGAGFNGFADRGDVDLSVLGHSSRRPGTCLALTHDGDRTLLTHIGANEETARYLAGRFDEVLAYLARARVVHVTSFLDPETPAVLLRLLGALRERAPGVVITVDPGHVWCAEPTPEILGIIGLADHLLLNRAEQELLEGHRFGATRLVKAPGGITVVAGDEYFVVSRTPLTPDEIADSTGAGDVFAAGLLAMLVAGSPHPRNLEQGVQLGMCLVRHKLRHRGAAGHPGFAALARSFRDPGPSEADRHP